MTIKEKAWSAIDLKADWICKISDSIWEHSETSFEEYFAADVLCQALEQEGFKAEKGLAGMETAFARRFENGNPIIGILGEYDALSGISLKADIFRHEELTFGSNGHNLLRTGSLAAAIAVKQFLGETKTPGTVIYYGCP